MVSTDLDLGFEGPVVTTGTVEVMRNEHWCNLRLLKQALTKLKSIPMQSLVM